MTDLWSRRRVFGLPGSFYLAFGATPAFAQAELRPRLPSGEGFDGDAPDDPLPSWAEGHAKAAIVAFVDRVTRDGGADFVPPPERIAAFDNDGTLWSEQPYYFQLAFTVDRVQALTKNHPEWRQKPVLRALIGGDKAALAGIGEKDILEVVALTHAGVTVDEFTKEVAAWTASARHPRFDRPYTELIFQPMLELLTYLRANGFKTFIVSGGGVDFMRPWAPAVYGVPPEQIVGSSIKASFTLNGDKVSIEKLPQIEFVDDGPGKPVAINRFIGRKPIFAAGNSDGDLEMLQWTTLNPGPRFGLIVRHTDAEREWAYDRGSKIGRLDKALDEAPARGWLVVDMKEDWKRVYPDRKQ